MKELENDEEDNANDVFSYLCERGVCMKTDYEKDPSKCRRVIASPFVHSSLTTVCLVLAT